MGPVYTHRGDGPLDPSRAPALIAWRGSLPCVRAYFKAVENMTEANKTDATSGTAHTEGLQPGMYAVDDPTLLEHMVLTKSVKHPKTGVALLTRGHVLTPRTLNQLVNVGIDTVSAAPLAEESVLIAVEHIRDYLHSVEKIIGTKNQTVRNATALFQEMESTRELETVMRRQMQNVLNYFNPHAVDALIDLNKHHPTSAHHSIITGFNAMCIAKALHWDDEEVLEATMAAITHDVGKTKVDLSTLEWPGKLNPKQWQEVQLHTLFGGMLAKKEAVNTAVMVALNHHEWYADIKRAGTVMGYGALTLFRKVARESVGVDVDAYLTHATPRQVEMIQISAIADMVGALEEKRTYKEVFPPLKVLIAMNGDALLGHFNPEHYRVWHKLYIRKHRCLLPKGLRITLPKEKKRAIERQNKQFIGLDVVTRKISYADLKRMGLLKILKNHLFDLKAIEKDDGINIDRIESRGIEIHKARLEALNINPRKKMLVLLPANEKRLTLDNLLQLGAGESVLAHRKLAALLKQSKDGVTLPELYHLGIQFSKEQLASVGESLQRQIVYDLIVIEELDTTRALFAVVRAGDRIENLEKGNAYNTLDPLQHYLLNKIGVVELDFSALTTTLPDMEHVIQGAHWMPKPQ